MLKSRVDTEDAGELSEEEIAEFEKLLENLSSEDEETANKARKQLDVMEEKARREELAWINGELKRCRFPWVKFAVTMGILTLIFAFVTWFVIKKYLPDIELQLGGLIVIFTYCLVGGIFWSWILIGGPYRSTKSYHEGRQAQLATEGLKADLAKDFLNSLIQIGLKYIDEYYDQTKVQANKSFWLSVGAAVAGLMLVLAGVIMMYIGKTEPGIVTAAAGVISEFIATVFFYLYNRTVTEMAEYHRKLVITQNTSLALRITDDLPDQQKADAKSKICEYLSKDVNRLLAGSNDDK